MTVQPASSLGLCSSASCWHVWGTVRPVVTPAEFFQGQLILSPALGVLGSSLPGRWKLLEKEVEPSFGGGIFLMMGSRTISLASSARASVGGRLTTASSAHFLIKKVLFFRYPRSTFRKKMEKRKSEHSSRPFQLPLSMYLPRVCRP